MNIHLKVSNLIPQRPPFIFIDEISEVSHEHLISTFEIKADTLLCAEGYLREAGIMENIAQSAAAHIGYESSETSSIGVIGSVKNFHIYTLPKIGQLLHTHIRIINEVFNIVFLKAEVKVQDQLIATCEMKVAIAFDK